jgi:hypothetical protein
MSFTVRKTHSLLTIFLRYFDTILYFVDLVNGYQMVYNLEWIGSFSVDRKGNLRVVVIMGIHDCTNTNYFSYYSSNNQHVLILEKRNFRNMSPCTYVCFWKSEYISFLNTLSDNQIVFNCVYF